MLLIFLNIFLGAYHNVVPEDYKNIYFFDSILSVIILSTVCIATFITFIIVLVTVIKMFKR